MRMRRRAPSLPSSWLSPPGSSMATSSAQTAAAFSASFASSAAMNVFAAVSGSGIGAIIEDVRHARALLPYLVGALAIAAGSMALVFATIEEEEVVVAPSATGVARVAPQLSSMGRLAYWRQNPAGAFVLWAANLDGTLARPLLTLSPSTSRPTGTRWTSD